jgi:hypothetical protein
VNNPNGWRPNPYDVPPGGSFGAPGYMPGPPMQPYYGAMPPYQSAQPSGTAVAALVLAIIGWLGAWCLTSIPAFFLARNELASIDRGTSSPGGRGLAQAAYWISLVQLALSAIIILFFAVLFAVGTIH